jgi:DASH complex subunit DAD3
MDPTSPTTQSALPAPPEDLTPLEQDVLDEYERLAVNMKKVSAPE